MKLKKTKRILAWAGILILAAIYIATFILGVFGSPAAADAFKACIVLSVIVPVLIYAMMLVAKILTREDEDV